MEGNVYYLSGVKFLDLSNIPHQKDLAGRKVIYVSDAIRSENLFLRDIARVLKGIFSKIVIEN